MHTTLLDGTWSLTPLNYKLVSQHTPFFGTDGSLPCTLPGDIHSALLDGGVIADPYWGTNELEMQWVGKLDWQLERTFTVTAEELEGARPVLTLTMADTIITVCINGEEVGSTYNQFRIWRFDLSGHLKEGENTITLLFTSAEAYAKEEAKKLDYPIPYSVYPVYAEHRNLIRKTQCHFGWDWGPCILAMGVYESVRLDFVNEGIIERLRIETKALEGDSWDVAITVRYNAVADQRLSVGAEIAGSSQSGEVSVKAGPNLLTFRLKVDNIQRWWPSGHGKAVLYPLEVRIGEQTETRRIGFRTLEVKTIDDEAGGRSMTFSVNGTDIFAKGANWIPFDALPSRLTDERYEYLLQSTVDANMNMLRLWGGGMYEKEAFYDLCDEKGILIWQDCMFSCSMYPANQAFLDNVEEEIRYQVDRLAHHASLALWCGNNEDLGAITWYEESRANRDRYVIDYDRLNEGVIGRVIQEQDPNRTWWPSSPSAGVGDFSDNWTSDKRGDMHFWSVWHDGSPFEEYYTINPRFVSEFGFQSFPSLSTVKSYADEEEHNLTSVVMEHHQKNPRGNSIIIENFTRYYRFPSTFPQMLYLSQVQQAKAMRMAIEYWRTTMPHCMGTLYWQLNDNWPVASWSSIDYTGKWKLLHYAAKHFYSPALPIAYQKEDGIVEVYVVNDGPKPIPDAKVSVKFATYDGKKLGKQEYHQDFTPYSSTHLCTIDLNKKKKLERENTFIYLKLKSDNLYIENSLMLAKPKESRLQDPQIKVEVTKAPGGFSVTLSCTKAAFQVALDAGNLKGTFSDNLFEIRPTAQKVVTFKAREAVSLEAFKEKLKVFDLYTNSRR
ncbi:MAG TPA: glycoside hydrolase family 2 protein [Sphaerochaeta sp.]|nr:glycoside hydrolase family 2 protein [Sphaerochaeta sp.]